jgi:hydroxyethylthiazole kinase
MKNTGERIAKNFAKIKRGKPLIHHITNYVVMNDTANITLHLGALPVMSHAKEEVCEMVQASNALVINIGTLSSNWIESMILAGKKANDKGIPIILDVVGAGATFYRTDICNQLIDELKISVLKGNAGEIGILTKVGGKVCGVESSGEAINLKETAIDYAKKNNLTVVVTGKKDIVTNGEETYLIGNGDKYLTTITGTGCMSTSAVAAFCAVEKDMAFASTSALVCFGLASQLAAKKAKGPASFKIAFFDAIYNLSSKEIKKRALVE